MSRRGLFSDSAETKVPDELGTNHTTTTTATTTATNSYRVEMMDGVSPPTPDTDQSLGSRESKEVTQDHLDKLNVSQATKENKAYLDQLGGTGGLANRLGVDLKRGLTDAQVVKHREKYGPNSIPNPPMATFLGLFLEALKDPVLLILIAASIVSLVIGILEDPESGWIEGTAIMVAILVVSVVTAVNNYNKERQFRALEEASRQDERVFVRRGGKLFLVNPDEIVVGDLVKLKAGDGIPADGLLTEGEGIKCNESSLTGECNDLAKTVQGPDPFLLAGCLLTDQGTSPEAIMMAVCVGPHSQYGKIRATLHEAPAETPLQEKLTGIATLVGKIGTFVAAATFVAMVVMIWALNKNPPKEMIVNQVVEAFIIAVTIIVVAIPEGLPLAVTISLAYSTRKMYKDQNLIRVLSACETMGNATNICSDKTGTLTENRMTVVEGWFGGQVFSDMSLAGTSLHPTLLDHLIINAAVNSSASVVFTGEDGETLHRPKIVGSATEGALLLLVDHWGRDFNEIKDNNFHKDTDKVYPFNSTKKRATAIIQRPDGTVRVYVKGATELLLEDATSYVRHDDGEVVPLTDEVRQAIDQHMLSMADRALRTLLIGHRDFVSVSDMPKGWEDEMDLEVAVDRANLVVDGIVGIIDPLREDVVEAVRMAQEAGVMVRMVTGDNIHTAMAIAKQCGILTPGGLAIEGPTFRALTPTQLDDILPRIQVMARSSPEDKYLLVTRLNGANMPKDEKEWQEKHHNRDWATEKDLLLPGYYEEWSSSRRYGGQVVGVTGDGTNDAPALKAADVGLAMGITGTQVAKNASKIVILDDRFSSIVRAIMWGRCVYDNIRKFLQFQLTVNLVALILVFVGSVSNMDPPLNAVMMLWVNLIMDAMGALALGTEVPSRELLERKPYKRTASLISRPMWRNIIGQALYQLAILFFLLYAGPSLFHLQEGNFCERWHLPKGYSSRRSYPSKTRHSYTCAQFIAMCEQQPYNGDFGSCYHDTYGHSDAVADDCNLKCAKFNYMHFTFIFTAFVFAQVFNEFNARELNNHLNVFRGLRKNNMFTAIIIITIVLQVLIVWFGGPFVKTTPLPLHLWLWSIFFGLLSLPIGLALRLLLPLQENPSDFFGYDLPHAGEAIPPHLVGKVRRMEASSDRRTSRSSSGGEEGQPPPIVVSQV